jgi:hypothetical protein
MSHRISFSSKAANVHQRRTALPDEARLALSPGKKVNIRSELIDQLEKWHRLLEQSVISQKNMMT